MQNRTEPPVLLSRLLTLVLAASVVIAIILVITLFKMFPIERPQVFFLTTRLKPDTEVILQDMPQNIEVFKFSFLKEYIKARNEFSFDDLLATHRKWVNKDDGIVRIWSSPEVFENFKNTVLWYVEEDLYRDLQNGQQTSVHFACTVDFDTTGAITEFQKEEDTYLVKFKYKCSPAGVVAPITYHAKVKLKTDITDKTKWANRVENPLGIIVDNIEYFYENSELANDPLNTDITALSNNGF